MGGTAAYDGVGDGTGERGMSERVLMTAGELAKMLKSEETPVVSTVHHPLGREGLWHTPSKKVPETQQLPAYIQNIARALMRDHDMEESRAIATAVNAVKRWAAGRLGWGRRKITPEVQAAAQRALDEWEKLRAAHH